MNKNTIAPKNRAATGTPTPTPILTALFEPEDGGVEAEGEGEGEDAGEGEGEGDGIGVVDGGRSDETTEEALDTLGVVLDIVEPARTPIVVYGDASPRMTTVSLPRQLQAPQQYRSPPQGVILSVPRSIP